MKKEAGRKAPLNSVLRRRAWKDPDFGHQLAEWCDVGLAHAQERLKNVEGINISLTSICKFTKWWGLREEAIEADRAAIEREREVREEFPTATEDEIARVCQKHFEEVIMTKGDSNEIREFTRLWLAAAVAARKGHQDDARIKLEDRKVTVLERGTKKGRSSEVEDRRGKGISEATIRQIEIEAKLL